MDVATIMLSGPSSSVDGMSSNGRRRTFMQKIPRGGIHAVLRICSIVRVDFELYSTAALQKMVRRRLRKGATMQPRRANRTRDNSGT
jgi:hypothetical protein